MPTEPSKGGTVECKQCYRAAGQQARVHFRIGTCDEGYFLDNQWNTSYWAAGSRQGYR